MTNTEFIRNNILTFGLKSVSEKAILELLDHLEATEKERDALRALVVMRFDLDCPPQFTQGHDLHEFTEPVTAEHCRWFVAEIERLRDDCGALRAKIEAAENEREELHTLVAVVKKQAYSEYVLRVKKEKECTQLHAENETLAANLRVPDAVMAALDNLDDYIARIEGNDRGACNHINLLRRYLVDATEAGENK